MKKYLGCATRKKTAKQATFILAGFGGTKKYIGYLDEVLSSILRSCN